ncbi:MAG TPA: hypothetical protein VGC13_15085 [Longimicrobium sp.]|jgi:hypothetical protein|uniref:hypothetical protein n=1 Tax=Longimicrobium sp. TaxID=2029185 RepID=UPI002ED827C1
MKTIRKLSILIAATLGLVLTQPAKASAADIYCYYMGDVRDSYGRTGALWYCEAWDRGQYIWGWSRVEPY